jgi:hypothetical protein
MFGALIDVFHPTGRHVVEEQERQHSLVDDVGTGAPPLGVDLDARTVRIVRKRRPAASGSPDGGPRRPAGGQATREA